MSANQERLFHWLLHSYPFLVHFIRKGYVQKTKLHHFMEILLLAITWGRKNPRPTWIPIPPGPESYFLQSWTRPGTWDFDSDSVSRSRFRTLSKGSLIEHIDSTHNGIRYKCTGCGKLLHRMMNCRKHIKKCKLSNNAKMEKIKLAVHTGIRYKCTGCGKLRQRIEDCRQHLKKCKLSNINSKIERIELNVFK
jgi:predicted RNA-binding Zn-ribbon protein involved in translation (DUF1610 family)